MKLKHYYQRYQSQIRDVEDNLDDLTCKTIVSKCMSGINATYPNIKLPTATMTMRDIQLLFSSSSSKAKVIPYLLQNLTAGPDEYLKYYVLDTLTNQLYTDLLINMVTFMYNKNINFIYDFSLNNFSEGSGNPKLYVEYAKTVKGYAITAIVYHNPFHGDMELEDFESILLDSFYLLNPEQCLSYLTTKIASGISTITYSEEKEIELHPVYIGPVENVQKYSIACQYRYNNVVELKPIMIPTLIETKGLSDGIICAENGDIELNIAYLKSILTQ